MESNDYNGHTVVICWEHTVIPKIAAAFGKRACTDELSQESLRPGLDHLVPVWRNAKVRRFAAAIDD